MPPKLMADCCNFFNLYDHPSDPCCSPVEHLVIEVDNNSAETGGVQVVGTEIFTKMILVLLSGGQPQDILGLGL